MSPYVEYFVNKTRSNIGTRREAYLCFLNCMFNTFYQIIVTTFSFPKYVAMVIKIRRLSVILWWTICRYHGTCWYVLGKEKQRGSCWYHENNLSVYDLLVVIKLLGHNANTGLIKKFV